MKISTLNYQLVCSVIICSFALIVRCDRPQNGKSNVPKEILDIFNTTDRTPRLKNESSSAGSVINRNEIFAEGGSITLKKNLNETDNQATLKNSNVSLSTTESTSATKPVTEQMKLTILDFLTSSEETTHSNRTSSIKPRKGVHLSKIVPKKGVNFDDFVNYSLPADHSCFAFNQTNCYDVDYYKNLDCNCCEVSNELGIMISHQPLTNCSVCKPVNVLPDELPMPCIGICCKNVTLPISVNSASGYTNKSSNDISKNYQKSVNVNKISSNETNEHNQIKKIHKPSITNVPSDSDVSNSFSKTKGEQYVPIIVSIFVLPLAGVLIFVTWKKTRELWERRYYRRMDFLIDGMYNE